MTFMAATARNRWEARHEGREPEIDGVVLLEGKSKKKPSPGNLVPIEVTDVENYDFVGGVL
jgi:hypothetical protein